MLDNVGLRYPHRASGAKAPRTLRPLPLLRFAVSATGGAHLCSIQYYLRFWLGICRTSLAVSALRIMRYCPKMMHSTAPRIIQTFIESNDLTEKNVYLFCTSGSSGNDKSLRNLQPLYPYINFAAESIAAWLDVLA